MYPTVMEDITTRRHDTEQQPSNQLPKRPLYATLAIGGVATLSGAILYSPAAALWVAAAFAVGFLCGTETNHRDRDQTTTDTDARGDV